MTQPASREKTPPKDVSEPRSGEEPYEPCPRCGSPVALHKFGCRSTYQRKPAQPASREKTPPKDVSEPRSGEDALAKWDALDLLVSRSDYDDRTKADLYAFIDASKAASASPDPDLREAVQRMLDARDAYLATEDDDETEWATWRDAEEAVRAVLSRTEASDE